MQREDRAVLDTQLRKSSRHYKPPDVGNNSSGKTFMPSTDVCLVHHLGCVYLTQVSFFSALTSDGHFASWLGH